MSRRIPLVSAWLERRARRRLRRMMRGYRCLKATGRLDVITEVTEAMSRVPLDRYGQGSPLIFGAALDRAQMVIRQYALVRVTRITLNKALLFAVGRPGSRVVHPLPVEWRRVLEEKGFRVARIRSSARWQAFVLFFWGYGVFSIVRTIVASLAATNRGREERSLGRYAYFDALGRDHLPQSASDGRSHDVITWYAQWPGRATSLDTVGHSVTAAPTGIANGVVIRPLSSSLPPLTTAGAQLRFAGWGILASARAAMDVLRGRWWHALLLAQASSAAVVREVPADRLAQDYLFHIGAHLYRPLWTYEAERRGSRIILYNYSTNLETFKRAEGYPTQANSWHATSWPIVLVWDEGQAAFFRRALGERASIEVVGPIWFATSDKELPPVPCPAVAVFDVQPHRSSWYQLLGIGDQFFTPETVNQFLLDAHAAIGNAGGVMVLKRKRHIGRAQHPRYTALVNRLEKTPAFLAIDPAVPAIRVVERCQAVISMPFTSTALLGQYAGKPSIYYDPHGTVQRDDRAAHGVPIVIGYDELAQWVSAHV